MKRSFSWLVTCCLIYNGNVYAQSGVRLFGAIVDQESRPISNASVFLLRLPDSSLFKTTTTTGDGKFLFEIVKSDNFVLSVSHIGYKDYKSETIVIDLSKNIVLPIVQLKTVDALILKDVTVTASRPPIEQKIDRTVLNVDAMASNTGSNALEVLGKSPGVILDADGNIMLKGKSGVLVLIDDKPTYLSAADLANYLKSLPASSLDKIELMTNPPARYDAASGAGVINIKTKKNTAKGFNGSLSLTAGQAVYPRANESLNVNYRNSKFNIFANLGYSYQHSYRKLEVTRSYFDAAGDPLSVFSQNSYFRPTRKSPSIKAGVDYFLSTKTTVGFVFKGSYSSSASPSPVKTLIFNKTGIVDSSIEATNTTKDRFSSNGFNMNLIHQYDSLGKIWSLDLDYVEYNANSKRLFLNTSFGQGGNFKYFESLGAALPSTINIYSVKSDFTYPLKQGIKFETGVKSSYVDADNAANYFYITGNTTEVDNDKSNHFFYKENINAAYINFSAERKRFSVQAGLRAENTNGDGHQSGNAVKPDSSFTKHYTNLFPTGYLLYKLDSGGINYINLSYGRRIGRPYYQDLNPFIFLLDKFSYFAGNPYLQPQLSNNFELAYHYKSLFTASLIYNSARNLQIETILQSGNIFISTTGNIGRRIYRGVSLSANVKPLKFWTLDAYTELVNKRYKGLVATSKLNTNGGYWYLNLTNQFVFNQGWSGEISGFYITGGTDAQFVKAANWTLNAAIQKSILNKKGSLKLTVRDIFHSIEPRGKITNIPSATASYHNYLDNQVAILGFTYNFGKAFKTATRRNSGAEEENRIKN